jgi:hypothetical protein
MQGVHRGDDIDDILAIDDAEPRIIPIHRINKSCKTHDLLGSRQLLLVVLHYLRAFGNVGVDVAAELLLRLWPCSAPRVAR